MVDNALFRKTDKTRFKNVVPKRGGDLKIFIYLCMMVPIGSPINMLPREVDLVVEQRRAFSVAACTLCNDSH